MQKPNQIRQVSLLSAFGSPAPFRGFRHPGEQPGRRNVPVDATRNALGDSARGGT